ncbi:MAG: hypothetical protein N3E42_01965 [Candidatus Bipolaricaulota bacterium]|nr:hypothetical protein [Candidatus Bipolaricaulota bacterium]
MPRIREALGLTQVPYCYIQTPSYLKASGYHVALLLSFGSRQLQTKRLVYRIVEGAEEHGDR